LANPDLDECRNKFSRSHDNGITGEYVEMNRLLKEVGIFYDAFNV
jgi:hypothetical protein